MRGAWHKMAQAQGCSHTSSMVGTAPHQQQQQQQQKQQQHVVRARRVRHQTQRAPAHHPLPFASRRDALTTAAGVLLLTAAGSTNTQPAQAAAAAPAPVRKPFCGVVERPPSWAYTAPWQEDVIAFAGGQTWYRWVNYVPRGGGLLSSLNRRYSLASPDKLPLLVIAGGPGFSSAYLEPLELMAGAGRQVIFFDPVGCGNTFLASNSSCPPAEALTLELYLQQVAAVRAALDLQRCHLYGQGVGGMLALKHAASSTGIVSVSVGSVAPSYEQLAADRRAAAAQLLGAAGSQALFAADAAGGGSGALLVSKGSSGDAQAAWQQYSQQCVSRLPAAGDAGGGCVARALQQQSQPVFAALAGSRYFEAAGALARWSVGGGGSSVDAAALQDVPVLISRGEFDEVSAASAAQLASALPSSGGKVLTCAGSGSFMHIDAWEPHLTAVEEHMCAAEGSQPPAGSA